MVSTSRKIIRRDSLSTIAPIPAPTVEETPQAVAIEPETVATVPVEESLLETVSAIPPEIEDVAELSPITILEPASPSIDIEQTPSIIIDPEHTPSVNIPPIPEYTEAELVANAEHLKPVSEQPVTVSIPEPEIETVMEMPQNIKRDLYPPIPLRFWESS